MAIDDSIAKCDHGPPAHWGRVDRTAYTLIELTIVLAIVTAFAMMSWPVLMKPWQRSEAQQAAEVIREALLETRITAMNEGHTFEFRWKANTGEYEVVSRDPVQNAPEQNRLDPAESMAMPSRREALDLLVRRSDDQQQMMHVKLMQSKLPIGNIFFDARAVESAFFHDDFDPTGERKRFTPVGNGNPDDEIRQRRDRMQSWRSIKFYPDGRADNQTLVIRSENDYEVDVVLRGLTGGVTLSRPRRVQRQAIDLNEIEQIDLSNLTGEVVSDSENEMDRDAE